MSCILRGPGPVDLPVLITTLRTMKHLVVCKGVQALSPSTMRMCLLTAVWACAQAKAMPTILAKTVFTAQ